MVQEVLPSQEEVVRRTEAITRCIQELLISAKDEKVKIIEYKISYFASELWIRIPFFRDPVPAVFLSKDMDPALQNCNDFLTSQKMAESFL